MRRISLALALCCVAAGANAQGVPPYTGDQGAQPVDIRRDVPPVLTPPPTGPDAGVQDEAISRFRAAYAAQGSPRLAIFWNRILTDHIGSPPVPLNAYVPPEQGRDSGARPAVMAEGDAWRFENAFTETFIKAGAQLVDRNTIIRITGVTASVPQNQQSAEMAALRGLADLFIEVLVSPDPASPSGYIFRMTTKDVKTGRLVADGTSNGATGTTEFVATNAGFVERPIPATTATSGTVVAMATMNRLTEIWRR